MKVCRHNIVLGYFCPECGVNVGDVGTKLGSREQAKSEPGLRYDAGKPRFDLIPPEFMVALAHHYEVGARKYADRNWEKGMSWGRCFRSSMSHLWAWWGGEEFDMETGSHHMICVAWNVAALYVYHQRNVGTDDRWRVLKMPQVAWQPDQLPKAPSAP